mgnify:CR=1 FL=1
MEQTEWCPGNGTRYNLLYGKTSEGRYLIAWMKFGGSGGVCFSWNEGTHIHYDYIGEKMDLRRGDAAGILAFLETKGHEVILP